MAREEGIPLTEEMEGLVGMGSGRPLKVRTTVFVPVDPLIGILDRLAMELEVKGFFSPRAAVLGRFAADSLPLRGAVGTEVVTGAIF